MCARYTSLRLVLPLTALLVCLPATARPDAGTPAGGVPISIELDGGVAIDLEPATSTRTASGVAAADGGPAAPPPYEPLRQAARHVRALIEDRLPVELEAAALFDVPLHDEQAIRAEIERLSVLLSEVARRTADASLPDADAGASRRRRGKKLPAEDAAPDAGPLDAVFPLDAPAFEARLELDRARLEFYRLPEERRDSLLERHAQRRAAALAAKDKPRAAGAEERAKEAEKEQQLALEEAQRAHSEAQRLVAEEHARLLGVSAAQAGFEAELARRETQLRERTEATLAFRRRVREVVQAEAPPSITDPLHDELRRFLRQSRDALADALSGLSAASEVPDGGDDRLVNLAVEIDRAKVYEVRRELDATRARLERAERVFRAARAAQLYDDVRALNGDRLRLLERLSADKRAAITGLGAAGLDQAAAELRQVALVLRYHLRATQGWLEALADPGPEHRWSAAAIGWVFFKCLLAVAAFVWWRRRGNGIIERVQERIREEDRRRRVVEVSPLHRILDVLREVRGPLDWLLLVFVIEWILPREAERQLEVTLVTTVLYWTLGGALAVRLIDALAESGQLARFAKTSRRTAVLRLRSLRLVGRTVVIFGLILSLSSTLVGRGTVYRWVFSVCWFAAIPVALIIIRWWRKVIFERIVVTRKKEAFEQWVIANQKGWKSFPAAVSAGLFLFGRGAIRAIRNWVGRFDVTRRALAYLFRRGLSRIVEQKGGLDLAPIPEETYRSLGPETASAELVAGSGDDQVEELLQRIDRTGGGVFAVVGERGAGKTTVLGRVRDSRSDVVLVDCPHDGLDGLGAALAQVLGGDPSMSLDASVAKLSESGREPALLIDNAHRLIHPVMGGLAEFDRVIGLARLNSSRISWFFAVDEVVWRFFERARGARPLFDEVVNLAPWREEEVAQLLALRCGQAGLTPSFEYLLERLPTDADEYDRAEAIDRAAAGYYRLLWDYSAGNPGVVLHMWRRSLGLDASGKVVVKLLQAPDSRELELLPDPAVFVLRAVLQLDSAHPADVSDATMLRADQVENALRYGVARGYFRRTGERYRVTWAWFRPITRFLQRRHLLAGPR